LLQLLGVFATRSSVVREGLHKRSPSGVPTGENPSELDPATGEATQSALNVQSSFLDMSRSTTARPLLHSALELRRAETSTSASQLEGRLLAAQVERFPENRDIVERADCQIADRGPRQFPDDVWPNAEAEADLIPTFADSVRIVPCPEVTVVDGEQALTSTLC
jgi:hypothetical protein